MFEHKPGLTSTTFSVQSDETRAEGGGGEEISNLKLLRSDDNLISKQLECVRCTSSYRHPGAEIAIVSDKIQDGQQRRKDIQGGHAVPAGEDAAGQGVHPGT